MKRLAAACGIFTILALAPLDAAQFGPRSIEISLSYSSFTGQYLTGAADAARGVGNGEARQQFFSPGITLWCATGGSDAKNMPRWSFGIGFHYAPVYALRVETAGGLQSLDIDIRSYQLPLSVRFLVSQSFFISLAAGGGYTAEKSAQSGGNFFSPGLGQWAGIGRLQTGFRFLIPETKRFYLSVAPHGGIVASEQTLWFLGLTAAAEYQW